MTTCRGNIGHLLLSADTAPSRFWFAMVSIFAGVNHIGSVSIAAGVLMVELAPNWVWCLLFNLHGVALLYGVITHRFNKALLFFEGILGATLWIATAAATTFANGKPDAAVAGAIIAIWLLIRYPTHWEYSDGK